MYNKLLQFDIQTLLKTSNILSNYYDLPVYLDAAKKIDAKKKYRAGEWSRAARRAVSNKNIYNKTKYICPESIQALRGFYA